MAIDDPIERFIQLFKGNERSYGLWDPNSRKMYTVKNTYSAENVRAHLDGEMGLGMVPILDDGTMWFGAIDIDTHGKNPKPVDILEVAEKIAKFNLPLIPCRSKSGGVHCYIFMKEPTAAGKVRPLLERWAAMLGFAGAEVFPKQASLDPPKGQDERPLGNWINLPYFSCNGSERYAIDGGKEITFEYFLEIAEGKRFAPSDADDAFVADFERGPPCLQEMLKKKVDEGNRNTAVFQAAVFLKRVFPDTWKSKLPVFNQIAMENPLGIREVRVIQGSVDRKNYQYKCREEPCRSFCNKDLCKQREFGITADDATANEIPFIDKVEKIIATPVRWALYVKNTPIELTTEELFDFKRVRQKVGEKLHLLLPRIKNDEWDVYLKEIMGKVQIREEVTVEDLLFQKLCEFLARAETDKMLPEEERREALLRHAPALISISDVWFKPKDRQDEGGLQEKDGKKWYYAFKMTDFAEWLKRRKALLVPEHALTTHLQRILGEDAKRDKVRVGDRFARAIWYAPEECIQEEIVPAKKFTAEF